MPLRLQPALAAEETTKPTITNATTMVMMIHISWPESWSSTSFRWRQLRLKDIRPLQNRLLLALSRQFGAPFDQGGLEPDHHGDLK